MSTSTLMHIGELARKAEISTRTLRFYEQQGLLSPAVRTEGGIRIYSEDQLRKVKLIQLLKSLGLSLNKIKEYLFMKELDYKGGQVAEEVRRLLTAQIKQVEKKIDEYAHAKTELEWAYETLEDCLPCSLKPSERHCPCDILTERHKEFPLMVEMLV